MKVIALCICAAVLVGSFIGKGVKDTVQGVTLERHAAAQEILASIP